ncbi:MAG: FAD-dependent oxidoreductase [Sandaracinaceae bacterium]|nr:FAD-dependent oxidoreductase [Sandaracinaceae bacterium]
MARTRLFDLLRRSYRLRRSAHEAGEPVAEHTERLREAYWSRRRLLRTGATVGAGALVVPWQGCGDASGSPVAIVGAGLAGLVCAHRLAQAGLAADVFEAWNRTGGRTFTARGMLEGDQICELGGELIDTGHTVMQDLASELGLTLDDLAAPELTDTFYFGARAVPESELSASFAPVADRIARQLEATFELDAMGEPTAAAAAAFMRLDTTSLRAWLEDPASGADATIRSVLDVAYTGEFGLPSDEQSVLNLMYLVDYESPDPFRIFGDSDERFHLHEGSSSICEALTALYEAQIQLEHKLVAVREGSGGKVKLVFEAGASTIEREYEQVVLTVPFTTLRDVTIDLPLSPEKRTLIDELGYGQNAKLMMQTRARPWRDAMRSGAGFAEGGAQTFWDSARGQDGAQGILTHFAGGDDGIALGTGTPESHADRVAALLEPIFPGFGASRNGRVLRMHWPSQEHFRGSYACYRPGQWAIGGLEGVTEAGDRLYFAGEHTSIESQGYMEGAAETGQSAAQAILAARGLTRRSEMLVSAGLVRPSAQRGVRSALRVVADAARRARR